MKDEDNLNMKDEENLNMNPETNEEKKKRPIKSYIIELLFYAVLVCASATIIPKYVIQRTVVEGPSMENTLFNEENLLVEKLSYHFDALDRFDIIVFYPYGRAEGEYFVKRIIGMPGETVQIIGSDIYINGKVLKEDYGKDPITFAGIAADPIKLGDDEYFVLGDNREISFDSRYEDVGVVSKENIGGRAILRILPFNRFGLID